MEFCQSLHGTAKVCQVNWHNNGNDVAGIYWCSFAVVQYIQDHSGQPGEPTLEESCVKKEQVRRNLHATWAQILHTSMIASLIPPHQRRPWVLTLEGVLSTVEWPFVYVQCLALHDTNECVM